MTFGSMYLPSYFSDVPMVVDTTINNKSSNKSSGGDKKQLQRIEDTMKLLVKKTTGGAANGSTSTADIRMQLIQFFRSAGIVC